MIESKQDRMLKASNLLAKRLKMIEEARLANKTNNVNDSDILFMNCDFKKI